MKLSVKKTIGFRMTPSYRSSGAGALKWIVILAFIAVGGWAALLSFSQQSMRTELESLRSANAQLQQEKQDLEARLTQNAKPTEDPNAGELAKLRGEIVRLRGVEKELQKSKADNQQLQAQIGQLQLVNSEAAAIRTQNTQLQGALQAKAAMDTCQIQLKQIAAAKATWAADNRRNAVDIPTDVDLFGKYLPQKPVCPAGGVYNLGPVHAKPTCTVPGHNY